MTRNDISAELVGADQCWDGQFLLLSMTRLLLMLTSRRAQLLLFLRVLMTLLLFMFLFRLWYFGVLQQGSSEEKVIELLPYEELKLVYRDSTYIKLVRKVTSMFRGIGIKLILIEPHILLHLTSRKENEDIFAEYFRCNYCTLQVVTFLSESDNVDKLNMLETHCEHAGNGNYLCDLQLHVLVLIIKATVHDNYVRYNQVVQVPKRFTRNISKDQLIIGQFNASNDWYGSQYVRTDLIIPKQHSNFLRQLKYSRYIGCNQMRSKEFLDLHPQSRNEKFEKMFIEYIKEMKRVTTQLKIPFWIMSGITLGWFRQCGVIPYTKDIDLAVYADNYSEKFFKLFKNSRLLRPTFSLGEPEFGFLMRLNKTLDLCFVYNEKNTSWIGTYDFDKYRIYKSVFPKIRLCSTELLAQRILVPCDTEAMLETEYGPDWFTPQTKYNYMTGAKNLHLAKQLSKSTWNVATMYN